MWTCPNCNKSFRNKNQWHSCARLDIEDHLRNKDDHVRSTFEKIVSEVRKFGEFEIVPITSSIQFRTCATFLSVITRKDHLILEFQLNREVDDLSVIRSVRISSRRVFYRLAVDDPGDITDKISGWLQQAYSLINT